MHIEDSALEGYYFSMLLALNQLTRSGMMPNAFEPTDCSYDKAFIRHFHCALALESAGFHREAYLTYLVACECLLKDLYVLARSKLIQRDLAWAELLKGSRGAKKKPFDWQSLRADHFGHELPTLVIIIKSLYLELNKPLQTHLQASIRFQRLAGAIDNQFDWIAARYQDPLTVSRPWDLKCAELNSALVDFVRNDLVSIFPGGIA
jgi:hypothetical protein